MSLLDPLETPDFQRDEFVFVLVSHVFSLVFLFHFLRCSRARNYQGVHEIFVFE